MEISDSARKDISNVLKRRRRLLHQKPTHKEKAQSLVKRNEENKGTIQYNGGKTYVGSSSSRDLGLNEMEC